MNIKLNTAESTVNLNTPIDLIDGFVLHNPEAPGDGAYFSLHVVDDCGENVVSFWPGATSCITVTDIRHCETIGDIAETTNLCSNDDFYMVLDSDDKLDFCIEF